MKKIEATIAIISLILIVLNLWFVPFPVMPIVMSVVIIFLICAIFYFIFSFALLNNIRIRDIFKKNAYKETNWKRIAGAVFTGFALATTIWGMPSQFMYYWGISSSEYLFFAGTGCLLLIAIVAIIKYLKTHLRFYVGILVRIAIVVGLGVIPIFIRPVISNIKDSRDAVEMPEVQNLSNYKNTNFLPTLEHEINEQNNSIYCVTMLYAWEEIRKQINNPLIISPSYNDLVLLNNSKSFVNVLKSNEYSTSIEISENLITARAEFNKSLPFEIELNSYDNKLNFKGKNVASFGINGYADYPQLQTVQIVYYKNDDNFIIKLLPRNMNHEIILFKTDKVFNSMAAMNDEILKLSKIGKEEQKNEKLQWKYYFSDRKDEVVIPKFKFNIETNYKNLEGSEFNTTTQEYYRISTAWQRTAFILDEKGAEIESEAVMGVSIGIIEEEPEKPNPKKMIFDKDFLILLKRTDSQNPYFGLWVVNTELMIEE